MTASQCPETHCLPAIWQPSYSFQSLGPLMSWVPEPHNTSYWFQISSGQENWWWSGKLQTGLCLKILILREWIAFRRPSSLVFFPNNGLMERRTESRLLTPGFTLKPSSVNRPWMYHAQTVSGRLLVGNREQLWFPNPHPPSSFFSQSSGWWTKPFSLWIREPLTIRLLAGP